jgi:competence protein ComEC
MPSRWRELLLGLLLVALLAGRILPAALGPPQPAAGDPVQLLGAATPVLPVRLRGTLLSDPSPYGSPGASGQSQGCRVLLALPVGRTELNFPACPQLEENWRLEVEGMLRRPQPAPHPLLAGPAERLQRLGCWTQLTVDKWRLLERQPAPIAALRRRLAGALQQQAGAERGNLLAALVVGSAATPLSLEVRGAFRAAGLSHALAASGFQLSVLLGVLLPLAAKLPPAVRLGLGGGVIGLFVLLAGPQPAVMRAALMGAAALLLLELGRQGRPLRLLLLVSAGMLLICPEWLRDVGFQLSVVATGALLVSAGPLEQWLRQKHWPGWLAVAVSVPLAASIWTLPLQLLHFGVVPLYAVPANLLAAPLLTPLTLGAMGLGVLAMVWPASLVWLCPPLASLAGLLLELARLVARLPMAQWQLGRPMPLLVLLLTLVVAAWAMPGVAQRWRRWAGVLLALVVAAHAAVLLGDQLLLVHQGGGDQARDLLLARHRGRAALVSTRADGYSCRQAQQLATGLGIMRYDWALLLDPIASDAPDCWRRQAGLVLAGAEGSPPLLPGQSLQSPQLKARALSLDSRAVQLNLGSRSWLLLPDTQSLWAWRDGDSPQRPDGVWLGFEPRLRDRRWLQRRDPGAVWLSGDPGRTLPKGWRASGRSGFLQSA